MVLKSVSLIIELKRYTGMNVTKTVHQELSVFEFPPIFLASWMVLPAIELGSSLHVLEHL